MLQSHSLASAFLPHDYHTTTPLQIPHVLSILRLSTQCDHRLECPHLNLPARTPPLISADDVVDTPQDLVKASWQLVKLCTVLGNIVSVGCFSYSQKVTFFLQAD
jgi:hypothetical protein